ELFFMSCARGVSVDCVMSTQVHETRQNACFEKRSGLYHTKCVVVNRREGLIAASSLLRGPFQRARLRWRSPPFSPLLEGAALPASQVHRSIVLESSPWCGKDDGLHRSRPPRRRASIRPSTAPCYVPRRDQSVPSLSGLLSLPGPHIHRRRVQLLLCRRSLWPIQWLERASGLGDVRCLGRGFAPQDRALIPQIHPTSPLDGVAFLPDTPPTLLADLSSLLL